MIARIPILDVLPAVGCGRWPAKAVPGESFVVSATIFREGHDAVGANVALRGPDGALAPYVPMRPLPPGDSHVDAGHGGSTDRWVADVVVPSDGPEGDWTYAVEAWSDSYGTWRHAAEIKVPAGIDVELMLEEGARLLESALSSDDTGVPERDEAGRTALQEAVTALRDSGRPPAVRLAAALDKPVTFALAAVPVRHLVTSTDRFALRIERERALHGSWYEFFPRSEGAQQDAETGEWTSGTFRTAAERLPAIAAMGFDVVYLPPIHPVGEVNRKGPNNTLTPGPGDPGSPWAIGSAYGGHDTVHPDLGTLEDFDAFVARARELGMEVALDFALQCAPDHPWVKEHPDWFTVLADGTIAYAENPPKKYQDIYPLNFDKDPDGLYREVVRVLRHWMSHGVRIFRVDNPHTKPVNFWEWALTEIRKTDPDVIFLAEAFTRPPMMHTLAKIGYQQSYTYFTWRTGKAELQEYFSELSGDAAAYMRPNAFVNTPDILHGFLQYGGPPAFKIRAALAATLSPTWGVYSGFELYEHVAVKPGSEEYLDSEKYQYRPRDWKAAEKEGRTLAPYLNLLNAIRRAHPALHHLRNLKWHATDDDATLAFSKRRVLDDGTADTVLVVINLDPHAVRESFVHLDLDALGVSAPVVLDDEITDETYEWGASGWVRLNPWQEPAHIFSVRSG